MRRQQETDHLFEAKKNKLYKQLGMPVKSSFRAVEPYGGARNTDMAINQIHISEKRNRGIAERIMQEKRIRLLEDRYRANQREREVQLRGIDQANQDAQHNLNTLGQVAQQQIHRSQRQEILDAGVSLKRSNGFRLSNHVLAIKAHDPEEEVRQSYRSLQPRRQETFGNQEDNFSDYSNGVFLTQPKRINNDVIRHQGSRKGSQSQLSLPKLGRAELRAPVDDDDPYNVDLDSIRQSR
jgi:hypothetical protein